jgi:hypothetical protein
MSSSLGIRESSVIIDMSGYLSVSQSLIIIGISSSLSIYESPVIIDMSGYLSVGESPVIIDISSSLKLCDNRTYLIKRSILSESLRRLFFLITSFKALRPSLTPKRGIVIIKRSIPYTSF